VIASSVAHASNTLNYLKRLDDAGGIVVLLLRETDNVVSTGDVLGQFYGAYRLLCGVAWRSRTLIITASARVELVARQSHRESKGSEEERGRCAGCARTNLLWVCVRL
jgi:hypothetical protein